MEVPVNSNGRKIYRLVLTGGPCGGKTTAQSILMTFFENLGWKVFRCPEVATILLGGGVKFAELSRTDVYRFQANLMKTMLQIEQTFFDLAMTSPKDVLIVHDRGFMDATAYLDEQDWSEMKNANNWDEVSLRDNRYDHVCHLVTAADGAVPFYTTANNRARSEPVDMAKEVDGRCQRAWIGHPYFDVIDNSTGFDEKINRLIRCVATRMGIDIADRFDPGAVKRKWLVEGPLPSDSVFPTFEDFDVQHTYLSSGAASGRATAIEARVRKRAVAGQQNGPTSYQLTLRRCVKDSEVKSRRIETRQQLSHRDFDILMAQRDMDYSICEMRRRCFMYKNQYYQLDIFHMPATSRGVIILCTYGQRDRNYELPDFLKVIREVSDDPNFFMRNLTRKARTSHPDTNLSPSTAEVSPPNSLNGRSYNGLSEVMAGHQTPMKLLLPNAMSNGDETQSILDAMSAKTPLSTGDETQSILDSMTVNSTHD